jgi:hypothetical protein
MRCGVVVVSAQSSASRGMTGNKRSPIGLLIINPEPAIPFLPIQQHHPHHSCRPFDCKRSIRRSLRMKCSISSADLSAFIFSPWVRCHNDLPRHFSALHTDVPGRVDKATVLQALQTRGESYDRARETLKHVSVDASGKVELEDWVEVCPTLSFPFAVVSPNLRRTAQCQTSLQDFFH